MANREKTTTEAKPSPRVVGREVNGQRSPEGTGSRKRGDVQVGWTWEARGGGPRAQPGLRRELSPLCRWGD